MEGPVQDSAHSFNGIEELLCGQSHDTEENYHFYDKYQLWQRNFSMEESRA